ncbi:MAG: hypothetical protein FWC97_08045, partial [Treponema sp.]|nr:hypothetical protein [Treponema sp.]
MNKMTFLKIFSIFVIIVFAFTACPEEELPQVPVLSGVVTVTGDPYVGQTLTANTDELDGRGEIFFQWIRDGNDISGETGKQYEVQAGDVNRVITVRVNRDGYLGYRTSEPAGTINLPRLEGTITIEGFASVGNTLTVNIDDLGGSGTITYQWMRNGINISGTNRDNFFVGSTDFGSSLSVRVTRAGHSGERISEPTPAIIRAVTGISGVQLSATAGIPLTLTGIAAPANATNTTIIWSVQDAGLTGANIVGNTLHTAASGTVTVTAKVTDGTANGTDFVLEIPMTVAEVGPFNQWVTRVSFTDGQPTIINLDNLNNHDIFLVKVNTSNSIVTASSTGRVLDVNINLTETHQPLRLTDLPEKETFRMGRPPGEELLFPPTPIPPRPSRALNFEPPEVGDKRNFWVVNDMGAVTPSFSQRQAELLATGTHGNIWVIDSSINTSEAQTLSDKFDIIYPAMTNIFGFEYGGRPGHPNAGGVDGDPKIQILVYHIGGGVAGFFWNKDHYPDPWQGLRSNEAEIFYIDAGVVRNRPLVAFDTLTHELQHMIHFNEKFIERGLVSPTWFNEMLSTMAQDVIAKLINIPHTHEQHMIQSAMPDFLARYFTEGFTEWGINNRSSWTSYSTKYAFGAYLLRNHGGVELLKEIALNNYAGIESIDAALNEIAGITFTEALIRFSEAMIITNPELGMSFNRTVTDNISGTTYTSFGFDIWDMQRSGSLQRGPVVFDLSQRDMRPHTVSLHSSDSWKDRTGSLSITFQRPASPHVEFV